MPQRSRQLDGLFHSAMVSLSFEERELFQNMPLALVLAVIFQFKNVCHSNGSGLLH